MTRNLLVALALTCAVAAPYANAGNGEGFFLVSISNNTEFLNVTAVDPNTLLPLPGTFTANSAGEYELSGLILLDGDTANPIGEFEISGQGDPHLQTELTLFDHLLIQDASANLFVQLLAGIEIMPVDPLEDYLIGTVQTTTTTGSPGTGTPPFSPNGFVSVFLVTPDDKSVNAVNAATGGPLQFPGITMFDSGRGAVPALPLDTTEDTFSRLEVQHDLPLFDIAADTVFRLQSTVQTDIVMWTSGLPGDYNNDGKVDAADYTVWRDKEGAPAGTLPNDTAGGTIGAAQYQLWVDNFGAESSTSSAAVPEPHTSQLAILVTGVLVVALRRCRSIDAALLVVPLWSVCVWFHRRKK